MNMEELYQEMKDALRYFDLPFGTGKLQIQVSIRDNKLVFTYEGREINFTVNNT